MHKEKIQNINSVITFTIFRLNLNLKLSDVNRHIGGPNMNVQGIYKLLLGQASFEIEDCCAAFLKQMPNFNSLLTVTSDIDGLFALHFNS
jgi:hypothetical protein